MKKLLVLDVKAIELDNTISVGDVVIDVDHNVGSVVEIKLDGSIVVIANRAERTYESIESLMLIRGTQEVTGITIHNSMQQTMQKSSIFRI